MFFNPMYVSITTMIFATKSPFGFMNCSVSGVILPTIKWMTILAGMVSNNQLFLEILIPIFKKSQDNMGDNIYTPTRDSAKSKIAYPNILNERRYSIEGIYAVYTSHDV